MFDVPIAEKATRTIDFVSPPIDESWQIGCIVGPSGSGKSSIARHLFSQPSGCGSDGSEWATDKAVIDGFGEIPIKEIIHMLTLVGISSPPSWIKPYSVLSTGEKFRCDLARALLVAEHNTVVFDEYTSVVDRNVAKIASAALAKAIKSGKIPCRFIAVTCHYDILDWLEPDWVLDTATGTVSRRLLRRPNIELEIFRCERRLWDLFKAHHYLSSNLAKNCRCYTALWKDKPVAFCALIPQQGFERWYRASRIVTLPDYQGVGIGSALLDTLAEMYVEQGYRFSITASHPAVLSHCKRSEHWKTINIKKTGSNRSQGRAVVSFERRQ
jgi:GNAT superfamily N-acetyltransferase